MAWMTDMVSSAHAMAAFVSFVVFLVNGRYRTLVDRMLGLRLRPPTSQASREVSFEYLNRQLVWHAFTEFLLFLLPLVGISRWRRWLSRAWRKTVAAVRATDDDNSTRGGDGTRDEKRGELAFLPERTCAICYQEQNPTSSTEQEVMAAAAAAATGSGGVVGSAQTDIANAYEAIPCGCVYCFVCIVQKLEGEEGEGWGCLRCGELATKCRPWRGDVEEAGTAERMATAKVVGFVEDAADVDPLQEVTRDERLYHSSEWTTE